MSEGFVTNTGLGSIIWGYTVGDGDYNSPNVYFYDRYIQFGTGAGQSITDDTLASPVQSGETAVISKETTNVANDTARFVATVTADADRVITEAGVFFNVDGTGMEAYGDFDAIELATGDAIVFQVDVTITQAALV